MRARRYLGLLALMTAVMIGFVMSGGLFLRRHNSKAGLINAQNKAYQFRFSQITQGTNHMVYSGNPLIAKLKRGLSYSSFRPIARTIQSMPSQMYTRSTATNTTVLWLGWTHKDYSLTVTNGIAVPSAMGNWTDLQCFFCEPGGRSIQLRFIGGSEAPFIKEIVGLWEMPQLMTNSSSCMVHLKEYKEQPHRLEDVATIQLQ